MKKTLLVLLMCLCVAFGGCTGSAAKKAMEATHNAVTSGDFEAALNYAKLAVDEGCKDEDFNRLIQTLEKYIEASKAYENKDIATAEKLLGEAEDFEGSNMTVAIKALQDNIETLKKYTESYNAEINEIEKDLNSGYFYLSRDDAKDFLEENKDNLSLNQIQKLEEIVTKAQAGIDAKKKKETKTEEVPAQDPATSSPKAMLTEQEAIDVALAALGVKNENKPVATAQLISDYYLINITQYFQVNGETIEDEVGCKVDALTGDVYDMVG